MRSIRSSRLLCLICSELLAFRPSRPKQHHGSRQPHHPRHFPFPSFLHRAAHKTQSAVHRPNTPFDRRNRRSRRHIAPSPSTSFRNQHPPPTTTAGITSTATLQLPSASSCHHGWPYFSCRCCWVPLRARSSSAVICPAAVERADRPVVARSRRLSQSDVRELLTQPAARSIYHLPATNVCVIVRRSTKMSRSPSESSQRLLQQRCTTSCKSTMRAWFLR